MKQIGMSSRAGLFGFLTLIFIASLFGNVNCVAGQNESPCNLPARPGPYKAYIPRFFYDARDDRCKPFGYGGCKGNANRFGTIQECEYVQKLCLLECRKRKESDQLSGAPNAPKKLRASAVIFDYSR